MAAFNFKFNVIIMIIAATAINNTSGGNKKPQSERHNMHIFFILILFNNTTASPCFCFKIFVGKIFLFHRFFPTFFLGNFICLHLPDYFPYDDQCFSISRRDWIKIFRERLGFGLPANRFILFFLLTDTSLYYYLRVRVILLPVI